QPGQGRSRPPAAGAHYPGQLGRSGGLRSPGDRSSADRPERGINPGPLAAKQCRSWFPNSVWEPTPRHSVSLLCGRSAKQSFAECVPKQSLGTREEKLQAASAFSPQAILDFVVQDIVQLLVAETVVPGQHTVDVVQDGFRPARAKFLEAAIPAHPNE